MFRVFNKSVYSTACLENTMIFLSLLFDDAVGIESVYCQPKY
jgi:hypothetical protein